VVNLYQRGTASLKRSNELYELKPTIFDLPEVREQVSVKGSIEFRNLNFSYGKETVLRDINLKIEAGQTIAFVGRTGSGKSTLVSLVARLLDAPEKHRFY
jgi:ATP-binding cassette subfamily B protein